MVGTAGGGDPSTAGLPQSGSRRQRRRGAKAGSDEAPLSMTWPSGCALNWEERERVSCAALKRCSQTTSTRGTEGPRATDTACFRLEQCFNCVLSPHCFVLFHIDKKACNTPVTQLRHSFFMSCTFYMYTTRVRK